MSGFLEIFPQIVNFDVNTYPCISALYVAADLVCVHALNWYPYRKFKESYGTEFFHLSLSVVLYLSRLLLS